MRLAHFADIHISDRVPQGALTLAEQVASLTTPSEMGELAACDSIVVAGDIFDRLSTPAERNAAIEIFTAWAYCAPVVVAQGNHDRPGDLDFLEHLIAKNPIRVASVPESWGELCLLPWPRKVNLIAGMGSISADELSAAAMGALRGILAGFRVGWGNRATHPRILIAHAELASAVLDNGQPVMGKCDLELSADDLLETGDDVVLLGHIHKRQTIADRIHYAGSPRPTAFGQDENPGHHGYTIVDVERGQQPTFEARHLPVRRMITIDADYNTRGCEPWLDLIGGYPADVGANALRVCYSVDESERAAAAETADKYKAELMRRGAHSVKLVPRIQVTHRVRSEAITENRSVGARLGVYWDTRDDPPARSAMILEKLETLENEATTI